MWAPSLTFVSAQLAPYQTGQWHVARRGLAMGDAPPWVLSIDNIDAHEESAIADEDIECEGDNYWFVKECPMRLGTGTSAAKGHVCSEANFKKWRVWSYASPDICFMKLKRHLVKNNNHSCTAANVDDCLRKLASDALQRDLEGKEGVLEARDYFVRFAGKSDNAEVDSFYMTY
jgi:hypothetical protein